MTKDLSKQELLLLRIAVEHWQKTLSENTPEANTALCEMFGVDAENCLLNTAELETLKLKLKDFVPVPSPLLEVKPFGSAPEMKQSGYRALGIEVLGNVELLTKVLGHNPGLILVNGGELLGHDILRSFPNSKVYYPMIHDTF